MQVKRCTGCKLEKPIDDFCVARDKASGRRSRCRKCVREDRARYRQTPAPTEWKSIVLPTTYTPLARGPNLAAFDQMNGVQSDTCNDAKEHVEDAAQEHVEDAVLGSFGTPMERASLEALIRCGSIADAARELQLEPAQLRAHLNELHRRAARRGWAPDNDMTKTTPDGFHVKGVSTFYDADGNIRGQWVKTKAEEQARIAALLDAMAHIADAWKGKSEPLEMPPEHLDDELLAVYPIGDPHIGMLSWAPETGNNFDLATAERELYAAMDHLVGMAPKSRRALIIPVGDLFHADNRNNTTTGGTPVDSDGRWPKVINVGVRLMRRAIDRALEKHELVDVIVEVGNHDWHSSLLLAICLSQYYEREPRVSVDTSPSKYHWFRFGKCLIGTTHGDTVKLTDLSEIMATDRPQDWGETMHRYWITGHVHHDQVKELRGCIVRTLRTLAPPDAWHKGKGYRSGRDMKALIMHREWGLIREYTVGIAQLQAQIEAQT